MQRTERLSHRRPCATHTDVPETVATPDSGPEVVIEISFQKTRQVDREDRFGAVNRWIAEHPVRSGLLGGLGVVALATASSPGAFLNAPGPVVGLSLFVVGVWVGLIYLTRDFFRQRSLEEISEIVRIEADAERFVVERADEVEVEIPEPSYRMYLPPEVEPNTDRPGDATRIWLIIEGENAETYVVETKVTAEEAASYPRADDVDEVDQELPIHLASKLLALSADDG